MHLERLSAPAHHPGSVRPTGRLRTDADGRTFEQALVDMQRVRNPDDLDNDGIVGDAERLVRKLRDLAEQLAIEALMNPGKVDPVRMREAMARINRLADQLTERIEDGGAITREDLADISAEAIDIYQWACEPHHERSASDLAARDNPAIDGNISWRTERPGADRAALNVLRAPIPMPDNQRIEWREVTDRRAA